MISHHERALRGHTGALRRRSPRYPPPVRPHRFAPLLLVALIFAVFHSVRDHEFVDYDDHPYILENPNLESGFGLESITRAFTTPYVANWIPLTWVSLAIDHSLYGTEPAGYHLTNVVLHALSTLLLFAALLRMTGQPWPCAFVAAVFAVHPLHVESVAWATERKDTLCGLFWMLTLFAYARYVERPESRARYAAVVAGVAAALLSKPLAVTLPFALLLLDLWPLGRLHAAAEGWRPDRARLRRALLEKVPLIGLALLASAITFAVQEGTGVVRTTQFPLSLRLSNAVLSYALYLREAAWPANLAAFYPYPAQGIPAWLTGLSALLLVGVTALSARLVGSRPYLLVGWLWYLGTLLPMIGIVQVGLQAHADRYTYIPLIGIAIMLAWSALDLWRRARAARVPLALAGVLAILASAWIAQRQVATWHDTIQLFEHAAAVTDGNYLAHHRLAVAYHQRGEDAAADQHYRETLRINPFWAAPHFEYASILRERGELADAARVFARGLQLEPDHALGHKLQGLTLLDLGRYAEAETELTRALALGEASADVHAALGMASAALGHNQEALEHNRTALELDPDQVSAANNLAWTLATHPDASLRDPPEAVRIAEHAVDLTEHQVPDLLDTLAAALAARGDFDAAVRAEVEAVRTAHRQGEPAKATGYSDRLALYRAGHAFVEGAPAPESLASLHADTPLQGAVLILLDTLRPDHLSVYGYERPTSPTLEQLAARGAVFEQAISSAPWTLPAVAALLAGDASARSYDPLRRQLLRSTVERLVRAGYATAAFTEGGFVSHYFGLDRGFLEFHEQEGIVHLGGADKEPAPDARDLIDETFTAAQRWLEAHRDEPFFLLIHTYEPHAPYTRRHFAEGLEPGRFGPHFTLDDVRALQRGGLEPTPAELAYISALYDGGILASDRQVGRLLKQLERLGLTDRTLVVVTSDHGEELGEHFASHTGDHGHSLRDNLVRVPLIIANPALRGGRRRVAAQVRSVDILPTIAAALGVALPADLAGADLAPLLRGAREPERIAVGGFTKAGPKRAFVRTGAFKYIENTGGEGPRPLRSPPPPRQLYDLVADPAERHNQIDAQPEAAAQLQALLHREQALGGETTPGGEPDALPAAVRERLRALGYAE
jgi:protein O-mannosyl-transferase